MMTRVIACSGLAVDATATVLSFCGSPGSSYLAAWIVGGTLTVVPILYHAAAMLLDATQTPDVLHWDQLASGNRP